MVTDHSSSPGRSLVSRKRVGIWTGIGTAVAAAVYALVQFGILGTPAQARPREAHAVEQLEQKTLDEKIDGIIRVQNEMAGDVKDVKAVQARQSTDIAVIKRQLGLDGLGPPPASSTGR